MEVGEEGLGGETETDRQGSEKAVSKFMILWKKLKGPTADALGSCGRKGCAQNREIKGGILIQISGRVHEWRPGSEMERSEHPCSGHSLLVLSVPLAINPEQKASKGVSSGIR